MKPFHIINEENNEELDLIALLCHCFNYEITEEQAEEAAEELKKHLKIESNE
jgi:hypothetical protein